MDYIKIKKEKILRMIKPKIKENTLTLCKSTLEDCINQIVVNGVHYTVPISTLFNLFSSIKVILYKNEDSWEEGSDIWTEFVREGSFILQFTLTGRDPSNPQQRDFREKFELPPLQEGEEIILPRSGSYVLFAPKE